MPCETQKCLLHFSVFMLSNVSSLVVIAIALAPALVCWWRGQRLARFVDDPALPERLMAARQRNGATVGATLVLLAYVSLDALSWSMPLMGVTLVAASHPLRKMLFAETWSLPSYVWFTTRLVLGIWGFWIALVWLPQWVEAAGSYDWIAAALLAALFVAWNARYAAIFRWLVGARPICDATLVPRFDAMVVRCGIPAPRFEQVDLNGGVIANALALPSLDRSSVLFSQTLLDRLGTDEIVAVCAHELAHLEHFNTARLRRMSRNNVALIVAGAALAPLSRLAGLSSSVIPFLLWCVAVIAVMAARARDRQKNETASDLRALELCGNPQALIAGLTRLYTLGRVPRRLDSVTEQRASHPSLARRIRDIRAAAGMDGTSLPAAATFLARGGRCVVTFDSETLQWQETEGALHTLSYSHLVELRVVVHARRPPSLVAVERSSRRWEMPLATSDVARVQEVLDVVDAQLPAPTVAPDAFWPGVSRVVLGFGAILGLLCGQIAIAVVMLLAALQPAAPLVAAAGFAALTAAAMLVGHEDRTATTPLEMAVMLGLLGAGLLYAARAKRTDDIPVRAVTVAAALGVFAAVSVAAVVLSGLDPVRLHQSARSSTATPVLLLSFAGALTMWRSRGAKYAAIPVLVIAAATTTAASSGFLDRFGRDPFLAQADAIAWTTVTSEPVQEFSVPFSSSSIRLSPSGHLIALVADNEDDERGPVTFHVGRPGGALTEIVADNLFFLNDSELLIVDSDGDDVELRHVRSDTPARILWRVRVADAVGETVSVTAEQKRWRVLAWDRARRQIVRAEGVVGQPAFERRQWLADESDEGWTHALASSADDVVFVESRYETGFLHTTRFAPWAWMLWPPDSETRFRRASGGRTRDVAVSRLDARCHPGALPTDDLLCSAFDGTRTRFIAIDPASSRVQGIAWLDGRFFVTSESTGSWLSGWLGRSAAVLNPEQRRGFRLACDCSDRVIHIAATDRVLAAFATRNTGATVRLYGID